MGSMAFGDDVDFLVAGDGHVTVAAIASELSTPRYVDYSME